MAPGNSAAAAVVSSVEVGVRAGELSAGDLESAAAAARAFVAPFFAPLSANEVLFGECVAC